jgi:hypothetical protein
MQKIPGLDAQALQWRETLSGIAEVIFSPPTTLQSVFPVADQRFSVRGACCLRRVCGLNRRTPLLGESERILQKSRTFHQADGTFGKLFEIDGNQLSRKCAVGCLARVFLFFRRFHRFRRVLLFFFRDGLPFGFFSIHTRLFCFVLILCKSVRTSSINELERIMAQHM